MPFLPMLVPSPVGYFFSMQGYITKCISYALCTAILLFKDSAHSEPALSLSLTDWLDDKRACKNNNLIKNHGSPFYMRALSICLPVGPWASLFLFVSGEEAGGEKGKEKGRGREKERQVASQANLCAQIFHP